MSDKLQFVDASMESGFPADDKLKKFIGHRIQSGVVLRPPQRGCGAVEPGLATLLKNEKTRRKLILDD